MNLERGEVVWGPDTFKDGFNPRPWLVLNNDTHPFGGEESITVTLTTEERRDSVPIEEEDWVRGGSPRKSYASPWVVTTHKHVDLQEKQGRLRGEVVDVIKEGLIGYLEE